MTRFVFLIEEVRRAEAENTTSNVGPQHEAEARRAEKSETTQQEELYMLDYQGKTAELEGVNKTRPGDELQAVLEATGNIDLNGGPQHEMEARTEEGDNTIQQAEPSKKHPGDALQADIPKKPKTEEEITKEVVLPPIPQKWNKKQKQPVRPVTGDSQDVDLTSTSGQGKE